MTKFTKPIKREENKEETQEYKENDKTNHLTNDETKYIGYENMVDLYENDEDEEEEEGIGCNQCYSCVTGGACPCVLDKYIKECLNEIKLNKNN